MCLGVGHQQFTFEWQDLSWIFTKLNLYSRYDNFYYHFVQYRVYFKMNSLRAVKRSYTTFNNDVYIERSTFWHISLFIQISKLNRKHSKPYYRFYIIKLSHLKRVIRFMIWSPNLGWTSFTFVYQLLKATVSTFFMSKYRCNIGDRKVKSSTYL